METISVKNDIVQVNVFELGLMMLRVLRNPAFLNAYLNKKKNPMSWSFNHLLAYLSDF